ncbi:MAG: type II toxin-antitoxin system RelE/ParE family toxin [Candidatus Methanofastidiosia archaeon]
MTYTIRWTETSLCQLKKLERVTAQRIIAKTEALSEMPFRAVKPLKGGDLYVLRIGDHRVIMSIEQNKMIIFVLEVGHRRSFYRKY